MLGSELGVVFSELGLVFSGGLELVLELVLEVVGRDLVLANDSNPLCSGQVMSKSLRLIGRERTMLSSEAFHICGECYASLMGNKKQSTGT